MATVYRQRVLGVKSIAMPTDIRIRILFTLQVSYAILSNFQLDTYAMRNGLGYDAHRLVAGRRLILGGIRIPFESGLLGHSDADVLTHAVCDALLGAAGLGDIGEHFPDTDPAFRNACSLELLTQTCKMIAGHGLQIINIDATVLAQAPRLTSYKNAIRQSLAAAMAVAPDRINIKATTTEGMGSLGRGEGIAALCIATLEEIPGLC